MATPSVPKKLVPLHFAGFGTIAKTPTTQPVISKVPDTANAIVAATVANATASKVKFSKKHPNIVRGGGAASGAGVGFLIAGPPGALVGGIVGLIGGDVAVTKNVI